VIFKSGQILLQITENNGFRRSAIERIICQKQLSELCGQWNNFRRTWKPPYPCKYQHWAFLIAYHKVRYLIDTIQEYDFQDPSKAKLQHLRKTIARIVLLIDQAKRIANKK